MGKFSGAFGSGNTRHQGIKGGSQLEKEPSFLFPKETPLFHPESNKEANQAIQVAEDSKIQFDHLNELQEMNWQVGMVKVVEAK